MKASIAARRTDPLVQRFVLSLVDRVFRQQYGDRYSMKCLQISAGVRRALERLGINSRLWTGWMCVPIQYVPATGAIRYAGFWGQDHHVWVVTEFMELVDLAITDTHNHPASDPEVHPKVPAIWWYEIEHWPRSISYIPEAAVTPGMPPEDTRELETALRLLDEAIDTCPVDLRAGRINFAPIVNGREELERLERNGNRWVKTLAEFGRLGAPLPAKMAAREQELRASYAGMEPT